MVRLTFLDEFFLLQMMVPQRESAGVDLDRGLESSAAQDILAIGQDVGQRRYRKDLLNLLLILRYRKALSSIDTHRDSCLSL